MTSHPHDELVELLTVERFAPWRPAPSAQVENRKRPRRRGRPATPAMPSGPLLVPLDDPAVIDARRAALVREGAMWHDDSRDAATA